MARSREQQINDLRKTVRRVMAAMAPPDDLTVSEWADNYRHLSPESSAEPGLWRTSRTPYLKEPMESFTDPLVERIVVVAASQVGKSELQLNCIGYIIDEDPGSILYVQPTVEDAKKFSRLRVGPMIRDCPRLRHKVREVKQGRDSTAATVLQKAFPGGMLTMTGSSQASSLASTPVRYVIGDERDRWARTAGREGDPWELARARQTTYYNAKSIEVSTPTIKGASAIESSFNEGTRERWCSRCPECGEYSEIKFDNIHFRPLKRIVDGKAQWDIDGDVEWCCPKCGTLVSEDDMRHAPAKWIAENPEAYEKRHTRSFWLNAFVSPWMPWRRIVLRFLDAKDDPMALKVVYNTLFGELWEERGDLQTEDEMLARREDYGECEDGSPVELPDGVLVLTCGVDTQNNRLEYEVVGHGRFGETWGIERGVLMGRPDAQEVWDRLDHVVERRWRFKDGRTLKISLTCVDSGGSMTQEVYAACWRRSPKRVIPIKGQGGDSVPFTKPPTKTKIVVGHRERVLWLYIVGVDAGKELIMSSLRVEEPGPKYCHFPLRRDAGYDINYFNGLLSEHYGPVENSKTGTMKWQKIPGHQRNEPLDCRNYALAALSILHPDLEGLYRQSLNPKQAKSKPAATRKQTGRLTKKRKTDGIGDLLEGW